MYLLHLNNENGISFLEALFAVTLIFFIAACLLPQFPKLEHAALKQRVEMHASEAAFNGVRQVRDYGVTKGAFEIDDIIYDWEYSKGEICVTYTFEKELYEKCVSKN